MTEIGDLRALPLETLHIDYTEVDDLSAVAGAPLQTLSIAHTRISDLEPLRKSRVRVLDLSGCKGVQTLEPLASCSALERLIVPRQCRDVKILKNLHALRFLAFESETGVPDYDQTASEFWRKYGEPESIPPEVSNARPRSSSPSDNRPLSPP